MRYLNLLATPFPSVLLLSLSVLAIIFVLRVHALISPTPHVCLLPTQKELLSSQCSVFPLNHVVTILATLSSLRLLGLVRAPNPDEWRRGVQYRCCGTANQRRQFGAKDQVVFFDSCPLFKLLQLTRFL